MSISTIERNPRRKLLIGAVEALDAHLAGLAFGEPLSVPFLAGLMKALPEDRLETLADAIRGELEEELALLAAADRHN